MNHNHPPFENGQPAPRFQVRQSNRLGFWEAYDTSEPGRLLMNATPNQQEAYAEADRLNRLPVKKKRPVRTAILATVGGFVALFVVIGIFGPSETKAPTSVTNKPLPNVVTTTADNGPTPDPVVTPTNKPTKEAHSVPPKPTTPAKPKLSVSQEQAIESAESYIDSGDFSRKSLIAQLKYEDFTTKEATYAVDHITVSWTAEADDSAASYLETGSFSRKGLMDQLLYEGFTKAQAAHGVKSVGL